MSLSWVAVELPGNLILPSGEAQMGALWSLVYVSKGVINSVKMYICLEVL